MKQLPKRLIVTSWTLTKQKGKRLSKVEKNN